MLTTLWANLFAAIVRQPLTHLVSQSAYAQLDQLCLRHRPKIGAI